MRRYGSLCCAAPTSVLTAARSSGTAASGPAWMTITSGRSGSGNGSVGYSVAANTLTSSRSGNLTIGGKTINITQSAGSGGPDTTPPTVNMMAPSAGSTVSAAVTVTANVSDNVGVSTVQFYVDNLGGWVLVATQTGTGANANYNQSLDTATLANGAHNLLVRGYDAAGNSSYSISGVTVSNYNANPGILSWAKDAGASPLNGEAQCSSVKTDSQGNQIMVGKFSGTVNFSGTTLISQGG